MSVVDVVAGTVMLGLGMPPTGVALGWAVRKGVSHAIGGSTPTSAPRGPIVLPVYMDYHATTPVDPRVLEAMLPYFTQKFGNTASTHAFGLDATKAVENARQQIALLIGASPTESIIFTSGASESDNLAIKGVAEAYREYGNHFITSKIEHKAVLDTCKHLEGQGFEVTYLDVDRYGLVDPEDVARAITPQTIMVTVMLANNEVGTVEPLAEIGEITHDHGVLFHTDAVQGIGKTNFDVEAMHVDLASIAGHKMCGPKGVGALYVRDGINLAPQIHGGGHERGMRSGTLNAAGIVGLGKACEILRNESSAEALRVRCLRDRLYNKIFVGLDGNGVAFNGHPTDRLPGNLNVSFPGIDREALLAALKDVAISRGSACANATMIPSYVLLALGLDEATARASVRFGLGRFTTIDEVDYVARRVVEEVGRLRAGG